MKTISHFITMITTMTGIMSILLTILSICLIIEVFYYKQVKSEINEKHKELAEIISQISEETEIKEALEQEIKESNEFLNKKRDYYNLLTEESKQRYKDAEAAYKETYLSTIKDYADNFLKVKENQVNELKSIQEEFDTLQSSYQSRIEVAKREQEDKDKRNYYRWQLADAAIEDIKKIQSFKQSLSSPDIIDKILWKTYYEKATNELITRVIGNTTPCGIYKITNLLNEKVYIGQAVDIKTRLKQHVKSGVGAMAASNNKLYASIKQDGLWNFTWEVIEECPREKLNEREAFWIDFYDAAGYGLNSTRGVGV